MFNATPKKQLIPESAKADPFHYATKVDCISAMPLWWEPDYKKVKPIEYTCLFQYWWEYCWILWFYGVVNGDMLQWNSEKDYTF